MTLTSSPSGVVNTSPEVIAEAPTSLSSSAAIVADADELVAADVALAGEVVRADEDSEETEDTEAVALASVGSSCPFDEQAVRVAAAIRAAAERAIDFLDLVDVDLVNVAIMWPMIIPPA